MKTLLATMIATSLLAAQALAQSAPQPIRFNVNPDLPLDVVEIARNRALPADGFFTAKPERRPADVPPTCVAVQVMRVDDGGNFRLLGWVYLDADYCNALHGIMPHPVAMRTL